MKLCRFALRDNPEIVRSGISHGDRFYEADEQGEKRIHEAADVVLLAPIGPTSGVRFFESRDSAAGMRLGYSYAPSSRVVPTAAEVPVPTESAGLDIEVRIAGVSLRDIYQPEGLEDLDDLLGFTIVMTAFDRDYGSELIDLGLPTSDSISAVAIGPFVVTPDILDDYTQHETPDRFQWEIRLLVNNEETFEIIDRSSISFNDLLAAGAARQPVRTGELLCWPRSPIPSLVETSLGRYLLPGDLVVAEVAGLGRIAVRLTESEYAL